ncbi:MAG: FHA domain-containing protein [Chloroflexota bacterium]
MTECLYCGYKQIPDGAKTCPRCGLTLNQTVTNATRALADPEEEIGTPRWGTAGFNSHMNLVLKVPDSDKTFSFNASQITKLTLGRVDPDTGEVPGVDLLECKAVEKGVSRRHAAIVQRDIGSLSLVDQDSDNGTFLNGQRLVPNQARILRDGDEIRLGHLILYVRFAKDN